MNNHGIVFNISSTYYTKITIYQSVTISLSKCHYSDALMTSIVMWRQ